MIADAQAGGGHGHLPPVSHGCFSASFHHTVVARRPMTGWLQAAGSSSAQALLLDGLPSQGMQSL
jgi:hypothetical protein